MQRDQTLADRPLGDVRAYSLLPLWIGFLTGPIIWSLHLVLCEFVVSAGCSTGVSGWESFSLFGTSGWRVVLLAVTAVLAALVLGADVVAFRAWRATRIGIEVTGDVGGAAGRSGWMALAGVLISTLFLGGIVLAGLPIFWLGGCT
jgi:hypothetical protein